MFQTLRLWPAISVIQTVWNVAPLTRVQNAQLTSSYRMERALVPVLKKPTFKTALSAWPVYHLVQNALEPLQRVLNVKEPKSFTTVLV